MLATKEYARCTGFWRGASPLEAVRVFIEHRKVQLTRKKLRDVVDELISLKTAKGKSAKYIKDLGRLRRFANHEEHRDLIIDEVNTPMIENGSVLWRGNRGRSTTT